MKKNLQIGKQIALALILLVTATVTNAATKTALASGLWASGATWVGGVAPIAGDDVVIGSGINVTVASGTSTLAVASITINGTGILTLGNNNGTATLNCGNITISAATGSIVVANFNSTHAVNISGNISNAGSIDFALDGNSLANVVFNGSANQTVSGAGTRTEFNLITVNNTGAANANIIDITATNLFVPAGGFLTLTDGVMKFSGTYTLSNPIFTAAAYSIPAGTGIWINNSNVSVTGAGGDATVAGSIRVSAGTYTVGAANGDDLRCVTGSSITVDGGTLRAIGLRSDAVADLISFNMSSGTFTIPYVNSYNNNGRSSIDIATTGSTFTMSGGTIIMPFANIGTGGDFKNLSSTVNITGGTLQFGNASTTTATDNFDLIGGTNSAPAIAIVDNATSIPTLSLTTALVVNGDVTINAGTSLLAGGQAITVKGNWTNNGTFTPGTQTTTFSGSSLQTIGGATTTFSSLTINNTGAGVSLSKDVTVGGTLTLTDGVVATNATPNGLLTLSATGTLSGGSVASHISGPMARTGSSNFTYPVGNGTIYRPVSVNSMVGGPATVTARYFLANPRTAFGTTGTGTLQTIKDVSLCEYWDLDDGPSNITAIIGLQYSSTSPCNSGGYISDPATLVVAHWNTTTLTWENKGATGGTTLTNMTASVSSSLSPFTIGTTDAGLNGLPVTFTDVKAAEKGSAVQIDWTNSTESDMSTYVIERSANGIDFTAIGQTAPRSNQFDRVSYSFLDAAPLAGTNFYRIKAVEITGKNVYSRSLRVDIGRSPKGISLYPNPVKGSEIIIGFSASKGQYSLNVVNTAGQLVFKQQLNHAGGTVAQTVNLPASLKSGVYNLLISGDNYKETKMFVIQ